MLGDLPGDDAAGLRARIGYLGGAGTGAAEQVLGRDDKNCDALAVRADDATRRGRAENAVTAAQVIASECPDRDGYDLLARAYRAKGEQAGVRRAYLHIDGAWRDHRTFALTTEDLAGERVVDRLNRLSGQSLPRHTD